MSLPNRWLIHTITIKRASVSLVNKQPKLSSYETIATGIKARIEPRTGDIRETLMGKLKNATHIMWLNSTDIKETDIIVDQANKEYTIRYVGDYFMHHLECFLEERL